VHRYNAAGLAGLRNLESPGPGSKLTARQQAALAELVEAGPDPAVHGVVRWRRVDLRDELQRRFGVALHERSVGKILAKLGYRKLSVILPQTAQPLALLIEKSLDIVSSTSRTWTVTSGMRALRSYSDLSNCAITPT
jgi:hypothetical protein